jgi:hypothetical protein
MLAFCLCALQALQATLSCSKKRGSAATKAQRDGNFSKGEEKMEAWHLCALLSLGPVSHALMSVRQLEGNRARFRQLGVHQPDPTFHFARFLAGRPWGRVYFRALFESRKTSARNRPAA